jgi:Virulence factor
MPTTTYKILYWQEIPSQIRAEDEHDEVAVALDSRFMERIDQLAAQRGLTGSDDYLAQWQWGDEAQRDGSAQDVADAIKAELEAKTDW